MTCSAECCESRVKPAFMKQSFMQAERPAKDGGAGAKENHKCRAMDGYTKLPYIMHQALK